MRKLYVINAIFGSILFATGAVGGYILAKETNFTASKKMKPSSLANRASALKAEIQGAEGGIKQSDYQVCYDAYLERTPAAREGSIVVNWVTDAHGQLNLLKLIRSDFNDESFADCVLEKIKSTNFPPLPARAGLLVSHKFNFNLKDGQIDFR